MSSQLKFTWDPQNFEIKSKVVEQQLQPLVNQVTTLLDTSRTPRKNRGKAKRGVVLVAIVEKAIENFITRGAQIADENPEIKAEMLKVIVEVKTTGKSMISSSKEFVQDPCSLQKRSEMVKSARLLLGAVTRLLILADMIDVQLLQKTIQAVQDSLEKLKTDGNLMQNFKNYLDKSRLLLAQSGRRQQDIRDPHTRDDLAAARAVLKKSTTMLLSASKAYISHPDLPAARANKDQILRQICEAVETINDATQGKTGNLKQTQIGKLASNLESFENLDYQKIRTKTLLEKQLDELISGATVISESEIQNERKNKILAGCSAVREALQNLLSESLKKPDPKKELQDLSLKTRDLRRQLRKAVAEASDSFLEPMSPLQALIEAAQNGNLQQVEICAKRFTEHCDKLLEIANQVCELSNNEEGVKLVRYAASQLAALCPGVVNSARILAAQPLSLPAKENMEAFRKCWEEQMRTFLDAVDDITTIDDVLSVLDNHLYDDMFEYVKALQERNPESIATVALDIKGRAKRICDLVTSEMDNYEPCLYTKKVLEAIKLLNEDLEQFNKKTQKVITMVKNKEEEIDENEFIDATRLVYDGVREVRRAVLMNRSNEDLDPEEVEFEDSYNTDTLTRTAPQTHEEDSENMGGITVARQAINKLPEKEKTKILEQVENFQTEKLSFDREVAKWDDAGNDIVVLAKYMCMIMIHMTDFIRQKGPLKTTTDVISAAKKISETGTKLDKLTRQIADQCPESSTKKDLLAYLERVAFCCHQISIISRVKADVENNSSEELILAGVESATSLIENAKNLMNAVVLTVKASYVASTKYTRGAKISNPIVVWKMKTPEKKPLVRIDKPKEVKAVIRKGSQRKTQNPVKILAEFEEI